MTKLIMAAAIAALVATIGGAEAQTYPSRPITMIAPFPAGGPSDALARILSEPLRAALGQPIVIENVAGAGGNIGVGRLARAAPDGYTIGIGQWSTHVVNAVTYALPYDVLHDFEPIALLAITPQLIIARKNFPANSVKELVEWLKPTPTRRAQPRWAPPAGRRSPPSISSRRPGRALPSCPTAAARRRCRT
jgi:tripartite-type tricarboxylate transporter receptor subunit TctC